MENRLYVGRDNQFLPNWPRELCNKILAPVERMQTLSIDGAHFPSSYKTRDCNFLSRRARVRFDFVTAGR